jgi:hypothetical protein
MLTSLVLGGIAEHKRNSWAEGDFAARRDARRARGTRTPKTAVRLAGLGAGRTTDGARAIARDLVKSAVVGQAISANELQHPFGRGASFPARRAAARGSGAALPIEILLDWSHHVFPRATLAAIGMAGACGRRARSTRAHWQRGPSRALKSRGDERIRTDEGGEAGAKGARTIAILAITEDDWRKCNTDSGEGKGMWRYFAEKSEA